MTLETFVVAFPEFADTDFQLIDEMLTLAANEIDQIVWGNKYDNGHGYLTAHLLTLSPMGQNARLMNPDKPTTYWLHYERLLKQVTSGFRVA